jgi:hypothetical protein
MRRFASFAIPLGCTLASLAVVAACEDDPNPVAPGFDAQAPSFDANRPPPGDSAIPDAGLPLPDADAGPLPVTVNVRSVTGAVVAGVTVVFGGATGDVLSTATTDANGLAVGLVPSGAMATVVLGTADAPRLVTVTALEPGDVIVASDFESDSNFTYVSQPEQPDGGPAGAFYYQLRTGSCSIGFFATDLNAPFTMGLTNECIGPNRKFPVVLEAYDDSFSQTGYRFKKGNDAPPDGGTVTPVFGAWSTAFNTQTVTGTNLTVDGGSYRLAYGEIADGVMKPNTAYVGFSDDGGASNAFDKAHTAFPDAVQYEIAAEVSMNVGDSFVGVATRKAAPAGDDTTNIDFMGRLPEITSSGVDAGTPKRPSIGWTPSSSLATADGTYVVMKWYEEGDAGQISGTWSFVTPSTVTSVTAPALPASVTRGPGADANYTSYGLPRVVSVEASFVNGYADFRKGAGVLSPRRNVIENTGSSMIVPPLPANGTVKFSVYTVNGD